MTGAGRTAIWYEPTSAASHPGTCPMTVTVPVLAVSEVFGWASQAGMSPRPESPRPVVGLSFVQDHVTSSMAGSTISSATSPGHNVSFSNSSGDKPGRTVTVTISSSKKQMSLFNALTTVTVKTTSAGFKPVLKNWLSRSTSDPKASTSPTIAGSHVEVQKRVSSVFKNSSTSGDKPEQMVVSVGMAVIVGVWLTIAKNSPAFSVGQAPT